MTKALRLPKRVHERLLGSAIKQMMAREADRHIGGDYLHRWHMIPKNPFFNVYLHTAHRSDRGATHDHPWANVSIILAGHYQEELRKGPQFIRRDPGDVVFRAPGEAHKLHVPKEPVVSLFITGPKVREWGFYTPMGWVHHDLQSWLGPEFEEHE